MPGIVYKRPGSPFYYVAKTRQSTKTTNRKQAEEFARMVLSKVWRQTELGEHLTTWKELGEDWVDAKENKKSLDTDHLVIKKMAKLLTTDEKPIVDITADIISDYGKMVKDRASASTANRHLAVVRSMLRRAKKRGLLPEVPTIEMYSLPKKEPLYPTKEQFTHFLTFLPDWVKAMAVMGAQTGMRYSNVGGLKWAWINDAMTVCTIPATFTKTERTYTIPLSAVAREVLEAQKGKHPVYVFVRPDGVSPVPTVRYWWDRARKQSGLTWCNYHKLRHAFASWHLQQGTPDRVVQEMGGWASAAMLQNYAHLSTKHLEAYADNLNKVDKTS